MNNVGMIKHKLFVPGSPRIPKNVTEYVMNFEHTIYYMQSTL